jgi:Family of unknown function (DUF6325)
VRSPSNIRDSLDRSAAGTEGGTSTRHIPCVRLTGDAVNAGRDPAPAVNANRGEIDDELGPIEFLVVAFPGSRIGSAGFATLLDLADRGVIQILDLEFVTKGDDGSVKPVAPQELSGSAAWTRRRGTAHRLDCSTPPTLRSSKPRCSRVRSGRSWCSRTAGCSGWSMHGAETRHRIRGGSLRPGQPTLDVISLS